MSVLPTFYALIGQHALSFPGRTAVVYQDEAFTFQEIFERTNRAANGLKALGVGGGDRILWLGQNAHRVLELLLACSRLGASLCVANWRQTAEEIQFIVEDFDPKVVFWQTEEVGEIAAAARRATTSLATWIVHDGQGDDSYETMLARATSNAGAEAVTPPHERSLLVLYTAAFDGKPAGAQLPELGLFLQMLTHVAALEITPATAALVSTPMFHIVAWLDLLPVFLMGGKGVIARRVDAQTLCELIHTHRIVTGRVQPPTAHSMAELNSDDRYDLTCFRSSLSIPGWTEKTARGPEIGGCGQTEVVGPIIVGAWRGEGSTPFSGRIAPIAEARIADEAGHEAPFGELGELWIRGVVTTLGYWNRPEINAQRQVGDWWRTGDLARRDPDGTISFVAPKRQMLKSAGENIYAAEVEAVLKQHAAVQSAAIIGTPDPKWRQIVTAIVALKPGGSATEQDLVDHVRERIARYKAPRVVHFVDALPMVGFSPDYRALDAKFGGGGYPGEAEPPASAATPS